MKPPQMLILLGAGLLLLASCSNNATSSANYAPLANGATQPADPPLADGATQPADTQPAAGSISETSTFDQVTQVFDSFLALRANAIIGKIPLDELDGVATSTAIEQVLQLRSENEARAARESYDTLTDLAEWSNVTAIRQIDDRLVFTDCTERQYITPAGTTVISFVANDVTVIDDSGTYKVDTVAMTQDGVAAADPATLGCVPPSFVERAEAAAQVAVDDAARLIADPRAALATALPAIFAEEARTDLERVLTSLADQGLSRRAQEGVALEVIGMDVNQPEFTVVVSVCRTYPQGRTFTDAAGDETITDLPLDSSYQEWLYVNLEPGISGTDTAEVVAVEDRGPNCRKG